MEENKMMLSTIYSKRFPFLWAPYTIPYLFKFMQAYISILLYCIILFKGSHRVMDEFSQLCCDEALHNKQPFQRCCG